MSLMSYLWTWKTVSFFENRVAMFFKGPIFKKSITTGKDREPSECYKSVQSLRVTCLFSGQYNTQGYGTITDVLYLLCFMLLKLHYL